MLRPTPLLLDSQTAVNLVNAPAVTKKARHMFVEHHYVRDLAAKGVISVVHVSSDHQRADVMTKYLSASAFQRGRDALFNRSSLPPDV